MTPVAVGIALPGLYSSAI